MVVVRLVADEMLKDAVRLVGLVWVPVDFADAKQSGDLYLSLVRYHKKRRKQRRSCNRRLFGGRVSISERPKIVDDKTRFGDWVSDTMEGGKSKGGLAIHAERKSRFYAP